MYVCVYMYVYIYIYIHTHRQRERERGKPLTRLMDGLQAMALPPNFIHSLDSSHMLMTASACYLSIRIYLSICISLSIHGLYSYYGCIYISG